MKLVDAAEELNITVIEALKELYIKLSEDPDGINVYRRAYEKKIIEAVRKWRKERREWVETAIPAAYNKGLSQAAEDIKRLRKAGAEIPAPTEGVRDTVIMRL